MSENETPIAVQEAPRSPRMAGPDTADAAVAAAAEASRVARQPQLQVADTGLLRGLLEDAETPSVATDDDQPEAEPRGPNVAQRIVATVVGGLRGLGARLRRQPSAEQQPDPAQPVLPNINVQVAPRSPRMQAQQQGAQARDRNIYGGNEGFANSANSYAAQYRKDPASGQLIRVNPDGTRWTSPADASGTTPRTEGAPAPASPEARRDALAKRTGWQVGLLVLGGKMTGRSLAKAAITGTGVAAPFAGALVAGGFAAVEQTKRIHDARKQILSETPDAFAALNKAVYAVNTSDNRPTPAEWGKGRKLLDRLSKIFNAPTEKLVTLASGFAKDSQEVAALLEPFTAGDPAIANWFTSQTEKDVRLLARRLTRLRALDYGTIRRTSLPDIPQAFAQQLQQLHTAIEAWVNTSLSTTDTGLKTKLETWQKHGGLDDSKRTYDAAGQCSSMLAAVTLGKSITILASAAVGAGMAALWYGKVGDTLRDLTDNLGDGGRETAGGLVETDNVVPDGLEIPADAAGADLGPVAKPPVEAPGAVVAHGSVAQENILSTMQEAADATAVSYQDAIAAAGETVIAAVTNPDGSINLDEVADLAKQLRIPFDPTIADPKELQAEVKNILANATYGLASNPDIDLSDVGPQVIGAGDPVLKDVFQLDSLKEVVADVGVEAVVPEVVPPVVEVVVQNPAQAQEILAEAALEGITINELTAAAKEVSAAVVDANGLLELDKVAELAEQLKIPFDTETMTPEEIQFVTKNVLAKATYGLVTNQGADLADLTDASVASFDLALQSIIRIDIPEVVDASPVVDAQLQRWNALAESWQSDATTVAVPPVEVSIDKTAAQQWLMGGPADEISERGELLEQFIKVDNALSDATTNAINPALAEQLIDQWGLPADAFAADNVEQTMTNIATVWQKVPDAETLTDISAEHWKQITGDTTLFDSDGNALLGFETNVVTTTADAGTDVVMAVEATSSEDFIKLGANARFDALDAPTQEVIRDRLVDLGYDGGVDYIHVVGETASPDGEWLEKIANLYENVNQSGLMLDGTVSPNEANVFDMIAASGPEAFNEGSWENFMKVFEKSYGVKPGDAFVSYQDMIDNADVKSAYDALILQNGAKIIIPSITDRVLAEGTYAAVHNLTVRP